MKKTLHIVLLSIVIVGCNDDMSEVITQDNVQKQNISHVIPVEEAVANLEEFLEILDKKTSEEVTKSGSAHSVRRVGSVDVIRKRDVVTRGCVNEGLDADSLLYVVNFEDNQGYALLSADDRVSSNIIFVGDSGNIDWADWEPSINPDFELRTIYPEYPTTGPGTFIAFNDSTQQNETFMNPNTFDLRDSTTTNGYYVGNFCPNGEANPVETILDLSLNYVDDEIVENDDDDGSIYEHIDYEGNEPEGLVRMVRTRHNNPQYVVEDLLEFAYPWHQGSPFNNECLEVSNFPLFWKTDRHAGCVPLAIAKIMTYHQFPQNMRIGDKNINWSAIKYNATGAGADDIARLIREIGRESHSIYFYPGTFTFPSLSARYMTNQGFRGVDYCSYNTDKVKNMLDNHCPVFICSIPQEGCLCRLDKSHGWNLDGYMINNVTITKEYYQNDELIDTEIETKTLFMVHCDFGWRGLYNGYFTSGAFDMASEDTMYDEHISGAPLNYNYKWYLKMIFYTRP